MSRKKDRERARKGVIHRSGQELSGKAAKRALSDESVAKELKKQKPIPPPHKEDAVAVVQKPGIQERLEELRKQVL